MAVNLRIVPEQEGSSLCGICGRNFPKYSCPKCNIKYCTVTCYKAQKHSNCSEQFYKDSFLEALKDQDSISAKGKIEMMEMLKRVEEEGGGDMVGSEESDQSEDLEDRLSGLDLDSCPDQVWNKLTKQEQNQFHRMLQTGELVTLVEGVAPWWRYIDIFKINEKIPRVQFVGVDPDSAHLPPLPCDIQSISCLVKDGHVSPCVKYNVINLLYSYVYTVNLFNSCHHNTSVSAVKVLLQCCAVLSDDISFSTLHDSVTHAIAVVQSRSSPPPPSSSHCIGLIKEVWSLMEPRGVTSGRGLMVHAIADIVQLVKEAKKEIKSHPIDDEQLSKRKLLLVNKKLMFMLSWCLERGRDDLYPLVQPLKTLHSTFETNLKSCSSTVSRTVPIVKKSTLIQEL